MMSLLKSAIPHESFLFKCLLQHLILLLNPAWRLELHFFVQVNKVNQRVVLVDRLYSFPNGLLMAEGNEELCKKFGDARLAKLGICLLQDCGKVFEAGERRSSELVLGHVVRQVLLLVKFQFFKFRLFHQRLELS